MSEELRTLYPEIEPFETGMLDVGDGHTIYWERVGTRGAKPAVFLHGGPGGGISPKQRRLFDPKLYDVILFDQRGCGKSTPYASLEANPPGTGGESSGCDRYAASTNGWCSAVLGLDAGAGLCRDAPQRVSELVVRGIYTLTRPPNSNGTISSACRRCSRTSGSGSSPPFPRPSAAT